MIIPLFSTIFLFSAFDNAGQITIIRRFATDFLPRAGVTVACQPHKLEVAGAIPAPATRFNIPVYGTGVARLRRSSAPASRSARPAFGRSQAARNSDSFHKREYFRRNKRSPTKSRPKSKDPAPRNQ